MDASKNLISGEGNMTSQNDVTKSAIYGLGKEKERLLRFWWLFHWSVQQWASVFANILTLVIPFGLAALLYITQVNVKNIINIILLGFSSASLILQVTINVLRIPERAQQLRKIHCKLELAICNAQDGRISSDEFASTIKEAVIELSNERMS
jgi:hypothetical protein